MQKVYIVSPTKTATGGTELLHQLSDKLIECGVDVYMYYTDIYKGSNVEKRFSHYKINISDSIDDCSDNLIIVPETLIGLLYKFRKIKKAVWWLSVDFYPGSNRVKVDFIHTVVRAIRDYKNRIFDKKWLHFTQSEYARQYLINDRKIPESNIFKLSDYISKSFIRNINLDEYKRRDIILYNPKKGYEFTKKIIDLIPDIEWIPLINMNTTDMKNTMLTSKVYIDFGNHPGKDRIPREAALCGCCVITGMRGSAANEIDVLIPNKYKIKDDDSKLKEIEKVIRDCISDYNNHMHNFDAYREKILGEEDEFLNDINNIFLK